MSTWQFHVSFWFKKRKRAIKKNQCSLYYTGEIKDWFIVVQVIVKEEELSKQFSWEPEVQCREDQELTLVAIYKYTQGQQFLAVDSSIF